MLCPQDQLESVLDLFIANQRAALSEQQAQWRFLLQGLQDLQRSMCDMFGAFSRHMDSWFARIRRYTVLSFIMSFCVSLAVCLFKRKTLSLPETESNSTKRT